MIDKHHALVRNEWLFFYAMLCYEEELVIDIRAVLFLFSFWVFGCLEGGRKG